jgi:hypothetical protein
MKLIYIYLLYFFSLVIISLIILFFLIRNKNTGIPSVSFPFKNIYDDKGKKLNIILISAPFREKKHMNLYKTYKKQGLSFCGISSYQNFPDKILNPFEDRYHEKEGHNYTKMVKAWLHCFREPPKILKESGIPLLLLTEADLIDLKKINRKSTEKEHDFIYICLKDNDKCEPGWQSYNRNWDLAKKCLEIMCNKYNLKGLLIGRENCDLPKGIDEKITNKPQVQYHELQSLMKKSRFLFVPNISDASPRVITEALSNDIPILVNYNIIGGWHNVESGVNGEFFRDENDISNSLEKIIMNYEKYKPADWLEKNRGEKRMGKVLANFLKANYPEINNKEMEYCYISK